MKGMACCAVAASLALLLSHPTSAADGQEATSTENEHLSPDGGQGSRGPCRFANGIKHIVYLQFDNTHLKRDNANVPSDLEQMPTLYNFLKNNGTLGSNSHTILISHPRAASFLR